MKKQVSPSTDAQGVSLFAPTTSSNSQTGIQQSPRDGAWTNAKYFDAGGYDP